MCDADGAGAVGRPLPLYDGARQRAFLGRGDPHLRRYLEQGGFFHPTTIMEWTRHPREIARVVSGHPWLKCRDAPDYNLVYAFPRGIPKSTSTTVSRGRASAFFWETGCRILLLSVGLGRMEDSTVHHDP